MRSTPSDESDQFEQGRRAVRLAATAEIPYQAFGVVLRGVGLQCHLEATGASITALVRNCGGVSK